MILLIVGLGAASGDKPQPVSDGMQESTNLYKEGRLAEATERTPEVRQLDPDQAEVHTARGIEYSSRKEYVHALAEFDEAIRLKPDFGIAYVMRAQSYEALGMKAKAIKDRERGAAFGVREVRY
jgi:Tfp pilus assembly protein PilF